MKRMLWASSFALSLLVVGGASAQDKKPSDTDTANAANAAEANQRFREGLDLFRAGNTEGAYLKFKQAYAVLQSVDVLWNLAISELRSNRPLDALAHLREYQADPRAAAADREKAKAYIEEAYARTGHLKVEGPPGAEVLVDAKPKGACPITAEIDVEADQPLDVQIKVENKSQHAAVKCPAGKVVTVKIEGEGNAIVRIGKHTPNGPPKDEPTERSAAGYIVPGALLGLGVAGFVGAGIFTAMSGSAKSDAEAIAAGSPGLCNDKASAACAPLKDKQDKQNSLATLSYISLGVGAVAALAGVMTFVIWPKSKKSEVSVSPTAGGLLVSGKF